ncbi:MAG: MarR family winged helix-turn-helix transcriptional regulator [Solidesulfovibrio sp. DCME]|uniref:MarR family winged helix-turn-helix transcriptional regulator n=1 Tax=Solidesulfovibrio sp. DCME TaxID=3447380 RepID=UPI003D0C4093
MFDLRDLPHRDALGKLRQRYPNLDVTFLQLLRTGQDALASMERHLAGHGLSLRRFSVLILLARNPDGLSPSRLAAATGVTCATMTGVLDTLERDGCVRREHGSEDRRAVTVLPAHKGMALLDAVLPGHYDRVATAMEALTEAERDTLIGLLAKVAQGLARLA